MFKFAVLQLSGCAGCEVSLLNASEWIDSYKLMYMPLVVSVYDVPDVDILLVSGGVRTDEDLYNLRKAVKHTKQVIAVGTCAISGGVANLGNREDVRKLFLSQEGRMHVPRLLPRSQPIDAIVPVDRYLPGCPPTSELFMALLFNTPDFVPGKNICVECGRTKDRTVRPKHLLGFRQGDVQSNLCLINQGFLCVGSSTRGGCRAPCTRAGNPCVGCRGPSDAFIEKESSEWLISIQRVFEAMTDIPAEELNEALRSPQLALFIFQFSDYADDDRPPRQKEKVL
jgi:F420-non-reducing hydrogenase small subunit